MPKDYIYQKYVQHFQLFFVYHAFPKNNYLYGIIPLSLKSFRKKLETWKMGVNV